jgi:hypothetical protein
MMKDFVETYHNQNVSSDVFQAVVEKHMKPVMDLGGNKRMDWFFYPWVYTTDIPSYKLEYSLTGSGDAWVLSGKYSQAGVPKGFRMPSWLYLDFDGNLIRVGMLLVDGESSKEISIKLPKKPKRVLLNANHDVLATSVEVKQVN